MFDTVSSQDSTELPGAYSSYPVGICICVYICISICIYICIFVYVFEFVFVPAACSSSSSDTRLGFRPRLRRKRPGRANRCVQS